MKVDRDIRMTETFVEFLKSSEPKVRKKYLYVIQVLKTESVVSEKFIKHLENTNLYEMRVSLSSNEYRTIVFSIDAVNIREFGIRKGLKKLVISSKIRIFIGENQ